MTSCDEVAGSNSEVLPAEGGRRRDGVRSQVLNPSRVAARDHDFEAPDCRAKQTCGFHYEVDWHAGQ
jgi:hypothetical protein